MTGIGAKLTAAAILAAMSISGVASAADAPKIVSLNICLDSVLVEVADRSQILALSHYARNPHNSIIVEIAKTYPVIYESAEEVVALRPDLVLGSFHSSPETRAALARLGIETATFKVPTTVEESYEEVRRVAKLAGHPDRGEALIARIQVALHAALPPSGSKPIPALVFEPDGFSPGRNELVDEMLRRTGFSNVAADKYGRKSWTDLPLELVLDQPPQVLLSEEPKFGAQSWAERIANHPALAHLTGLKRAYFPPALIYCGGPALIASSAALAAARQSVAAQ